MQAGAREQKAECPRCRDFLCFDTDWLGRLAEWCPHCDEGRPHSRSQWLARFAEEDAAMTECEAPEPEYLDDKHCEICGALFRPTGVRNVYCGARCSSEANRRAHRRRYLASGGRRVKQPERTCQYEGCDEPCRSKWCITHAKVVRSEQNRAYARWRHAQRRSRDNEAKP